MANETSDRHVVFVTGGTGYMGRALLQQLAVRGHAARALTRPRSAGKLPAGCEVVVGDALDASTYVRQIPPSDTFVHLIGTPHPNPSKAQQFLDVDLASLVAAVDAAKEAGVAHFVYVSVAHPAPAMKAYIAARCQAEEHLHRSGLHATILRPWYVLGPGHRWPYILLPLYWIAERIPSFREGAKRLGLVKLEQMVSALVAAVENPTKGIRIVEVPEIRYGAVD